jgi:hypothetical protein
MTQGSTQDDTGHALAAVLEDGLVRGLWLLGGCLCGQSVMLPHPQGGHHQQPRVLVHNSGTSRPDKGTKAAVARHHIMPNMDDSIPVISKRLAAGWT